LLSVFLGIFTYVYTFKADKLKFFLFLLIGLALVSSEYWFVSFLIWLGVLIHVCMRKREWYKQYFESYK